MSPPPPPPQNHHHHHHHQHSNIKDIAGVVSKSNLNPEATLANVLISSALNNNNGQNVTTHAPPSLALRSLNPPSQPVSSGHTKATRQSHQLPWQPLGGEYIVSLDGGNDDAENDAANNAASTSIVFVFPDNRGVRGRLYITNFRLYFRSSAHDDLSPVIIDLPLGLIHRVEKIGHQSVKQSNLYGLLVTCKNGRRLRFACSAQQDTADTSNSTRSNSHG